MFKVERISAQTMRPVHADTVILKQESNVEAARANFRRVIKSDQDATRRDDWVKVTRI